MTLRLVFPLTMDVGIFDEIADEQSWPETEDDQPEDEDAPAKVWQVPGGTLRFVDDELLKVQYVDVSADPPEPVVAVMSTVTVTSAIFGCGRLASYLYCFS